MLMRRIKSPWLPIKHRRVGLLFLAASGNIKVATIFKINQIWIEIDN